MKRSDHLKRLGTPLAVLVVLLALSGCSFASGASDSAGSAPAIGAPEPAVGGFTSEGGGTTAFDKDRQVISTGTVSISADDPIGAADAAVKLVEGAGGRVDSRSEQPAVKTANVDVPDSPSAPSAQLVVRIPSAELSTTLDAIEQLGIVQNVSIGANDVTSQSQDLDARITALRASVDRLVALLATATTTKDLIDIETTLSSRQADLESLESQQRALSDQVDLATITVSFSSSATAPIEKPSDFVSGITVGWLTLVGFFSGLLVVIGFLLPWLVVIAIVGAVVLVIIRRSRRRRRAAFFATEAPTPTPSPEPSSPEPAPATTRMEE